MPFHILRLQIYNIHIHFQKMHHILNPNIRRISYNCIEFFSCKFVFPIKYFNFFNHFRIIQYIRVKLYVFFVYKTISILILLSRLGKIRQLLFFAKLSISYRELSSMSFISKLNLATSTAKISISTPHILFRKISLFFHMTT